MTRTLTPEQIERHMLTASECPPFSKVLLVSTARRLLGHEEPAPQAAPATPTQCNDSDSPWLVCKQCAAAGKCAKPHPAILALRKALTGLEAVLCDPNGKASIRGSEGDLKIIDGSLDTLRAALGSK